MRIAPICRPSTCLARLTFLSSTLALSSCAAPHSSMPGSLESHHHVRFQNGYVRVMETRLAPGEETLLHSHPIESAVVFLTDGRFRITLDDGSVQEESVEQGAVAFGDSAIVHQTANIGKNTVRVVTVEIFSLQPPAVNTEIFVIGETLLENAKARLARVEALQDVPVVFETATPVVIVAESAGVVVAQSKETSLKFGDAQWCESGRIELRTNTDSPFQAVVVLLKLRD